MLLGRNLGLKPLLQADAIARLLNRQNVLLRAPTGSGKTETAIAPFRFAQIL
ncbi:MAG: DEAD/DEAH box helicase [Coleofasciculus sp. G3-WIS-01]|uniref:DEAD/DEAH box helicase n=1 Tax=Coleofasciculus sp. G3-WIS-01 TaxID=3069528 RepID=UPI0032F2DF91